MRDRSPELRDVGIVHQPDAGAARAPRQRREVREDVGDDAAKEAGRGSGPAAPRADRRQADEAHAGAGRLPRCAGRRTVQAGALSILTLTNSQLPTSNSQAFGSRDLGFGLWDFERAGSRKEPALFLSA